MGDGAGEVGEVRRGGVADRQRGVVGNHVEEQQGEGCVRVVDGALQTVLLGGRRERHDAQVVLRDRSRLIGKDVSATERKGAIRRDVAELVDDSGVSHVDVVLRRLEAVQVVLHEEGLQEKAMGESTPSRTRSPRRRRATRGRSGSRAGSRRRSS